MEEPVVNKKPAGTAPSGRPTPAFGRFDSKQPPRASLFFSNLVEFLTERPPKGSSRDKSYFGASFGSGLIENLKEWLGPTPRMAQQPGASDLLVEVRAKPTYRVFWENLRDTIAPPKLPPLKVTSKPVAVKGIWSKNELFGRAQTLSLLTHVLAAILLIVPLLPKMFPQPTVKASPVILTDVDISPYLAKLPPGTKKAGGGGGGGEHNPVPASKGRLPKFSWTQFTPPAVKPPENARLQMPATVLGPPDLHLPSPNMPNYGDPLAKLITDSSGPGGGGGIGTGCCGGVGSGNGGGVGPGEGWGTGGGPPGAGSSGYGYPVCIYCPNPTFSDEAVKAKYQGSVMVRFIVTPDGRATDVQVVRGLGLGLDEKVIEAVRTWRLKPAVGPNGKPASVWVTAEVVYRLL